MRSSVVAVCLTAMLASFHIVLAVPRDHGFPVLQMSQAGKDRVPLVDIFSSHPLMAPPCACAGKECGCCQPIKIPALNIDTKACTNLTSTDTGSLLTFSLGEKVLFEEIVSGHFLDTNDVADLLGMVVVGNPQGDCSCSIDQCECCLNIQIRAVSIDINVCIQVQFFSASLGVSLSILIDKILVTFDATVSIKNPNPTCVPFLPGGKICAELYDISSTPSRLTGCGRLKAKFFGIAVTTINLGCFKIPLRRPAAYGQNPGSVQYLGDVSDVF